MAGCADCAPSVPLRAGGPAAQIAAIDGVRGFALVRGRLPAGDVVVARRVTLVGAPVPLSDDSSRSCGRRGARRQSTLDEVVARASPALRALVPWSEAWPISSGCFAGCEGGAPMPVLGLRREAPEVDRPRGNGHARPSPATNVAFVPFGGTAWRALD